MKFCFDCKQTLPRSAFFRLTRSKDGLQSRCKKCWYKKYGKEKIGQHKKEKDPGVGFDAWCILTDERRASYRAKDACATL